MLNFLRRIFGSKDKHCPGRGAQGFPPQIVIRTGNQAYTGGQIDEQFLGMLLGANSRVDAPLNPFEKESLTRLRRLVRGGGNHAERFPRLPKILPEVQRMLQQPEFDELAIANLVIRDQALVGDVMRLMYSADYRDQQDTVSCLFDAIRLLGRVGMVKMLEQAEARPVLDVEQGHFVMITSPLLAAQAEKTALLTSLLCDEQGQDCFFVYLAGLMHNIGFTLGCTVLDEVFDGSYAPHSKYFQRDFVALCMELTVLTARNWQLPVNVCRLLETQHQVVSDPAFCRLASILFSADRIAKAKILASRLGIDEQQADITINRVACDVRLGNLH